MKTFESDFQVSGGKNAVTKTNDWQVVFLIFRGSSVSNGPRYFSKTMEAIENIPEIKTAFFSVLPVKKSNPILVLSVESFVTTWGLISRTEIAPSG